MALVRNALKIVMLGKTGAGKSAAGNMILGSSVFLSMATVSSVTKESRIETRTIERREVSVVDTPGFCDTKLTQNEVARELGRAVYLTRTGPEAFLYVVSLRSRFTDQERDAAEQTFQAFGDDVTNHSIVLFTNGDECGENINTLIQNNRCLSTLVQRCGGRFHVFNNKEGNRQQVNELMEKIDRMRAENNGSSFISELYNMAAQLGWNAFWKKNKERFLMAAILILQVYQVMNGQGNVMQTQQILSQGANAVFLSVKASLVHK